MCLVLLAWQHRADYPLIIVANRDEFHDRPAAAVHFWPESPQLCAGRDLLAGGTWLGISRNGRFAAITNFRGAATPANARSRGELPLAFICGSLHPDTFCDELRQIDGGYGGFSLLYGEIGGELRYYCNQPDDQGTGRSCRLNPGIHGLSNEFLDTPWPKVVEGKNALRGALDSEPDTEALLAVLGDRSVPPDQALPDTGVGLQTERLLAPRFINSGSYGTRASTCIVVSAEGSARVCERSFDRDGNPSGTVSHGFRLQTGDVS